MQKQEQITNLVSYLNKIFNANGYKYIKSKQAFEKNKKYIIGLNIGIDIVNISFGVDYSYNNIVIAKIYNHIKFIKQLKIEQQISLENKETWPVIIDKFVTIILPEMEKIENVDYVIEKLKEDNPKKWEIPLSERIRLLPLLYLVKNDLANAKLVLHEMKKYINEDQYIPKYYIFCDLLEKYISEKSG